MSENPGVAPATSSDHPPVADWLIDRITYYGQAEVVELDTPLVELGLDSVYALTLCGDIEDTYDLQIDPTFFADFTTLGEFADGLAARIDSR